MQENEKASEESGMGVESGNTEVTSSGEVERSSDQANDLDGEKGEGEVQPVASIEAAEPPYSIFTSREKTFIVIIASLASLFSPLSANIYYPALGTLARDLHVDNSLINLTVTTYLIFQGLAPMFVGSVADAKGRRPAYVICFTVYIAACIGLALQTNYAALMVLRCVQSSGSSGTVAVASAVIADCVTTSERGSYMGYALMGGLIGPAIGPVIGGLLDRFLGWRAIFWFLVIFGGLTLTTIVLFLPETARNVVGNGSLPAGRWNTSLLAYLRQRKLRESGNAPEEASRAKTQRPNPMTSVYILLDKECAPLLLYAGLLFAGFYMVIASLPSQLIARFHYNSLQVGLVYIPFGVGMMLSAISVGKFMDWNFRRLAAAHGMVVSKTKQQDLSNFPIETARLQVVVPLMLASALLTVAYGWVMERTESLGGIVALLFFMSWTLSGTFQGLNTLIVDLNRKSPGAATGAMNLARCWLGAGGVALVGPLIDAVGNGWMSVLVAGSWVIFCPAVLLVMKKGPQWREEKRLREEGETRMAEAERAAVDLEAGARKMPNEEGQKRGENP